MATEGRVTQDLVELLSQPTGVALRVTQDTVELLSQPTSVALRVSQDLVELLSQTVAVSTATVSTQPYVWGPL